jgi:putative addiction module killer protein
MQRLALSMDIQPFDLELYTTTDGQIPFQAWLDELRDRQGQAKIKARLARVRKGNLGNYKSLGDGVLELKVDFGPGYRVYFGQAGKTIVLLLCGGDKASQARDIQSAKTYWAEYEQR